MRLRDLNLSLQAIEISWAVRADADLIENLNHARNARELRGTGGKESSRDDTLESPRTETPGGPTHSNGRSDVHD